MISTKVLPESILDRVKQSKLLYAIGRQLRFECGSLLGSRHVDGIPSHCHYNDFMLRSTKISDVQSYMYHAEEFVGLLSDALVSVGKGWPDVSAVLDIGCGYGRIVRVLRQYVPARRIFVCDVIEEGAKFTSQEFGVTAMPVLEKAAGEFDGKFDLAYALSVYTHTPDGFMARHVRLVSQSLRPGGLYVFTTQGPVSAGTAERYGQTWLDKAAVARDMNERGFSFQQYPHYRSTYGMTWCNREYVQRVVEQTDVGLDLISYAPAAHGGHQDVWVYQKS